MSGATFGFVQDVEGCFQGRCKDWGLSEKTFQDARVKSEQALQHMRNEYDAGKLPALSIAATSDDLPHLSKLAQNFTAGAQDIVLFGIGGSALASRALRQLARFMQLGERIQPELHVMDNPETPWMERFISRLDLDGLHFLVISKSGGTAETLMQCLWTIDYLQVHGLGTNLGSRMLIITDPEKNGEHNPLRCLAAQYNIPVLDHPVDIGGRYSVFSIVGMLPALLLGLDVGKLRAAGHDVLRQTFQAGEDLQNNPALMGALVQWAFIQEECLNAVVMMPYTSHLTLFTAWWRQLWAESLGKQGLGPLPVGAVGPLDQHSQLQLFLDGPNDKLFTIIMPDVAGQGYRAPRYLATFTDERLSCLGGRTIGDLIDCEQRATATTLLRYGRPVRTIRIGALSEATLGALFMHFMLEVILLGYMLGVDPFNQPAVETSKILTRQLLGEVSVPEL